MSCEVLWIFLSIFIVVGMISKRSSWCCEYELCEKELCSSYSGWNVEEWEKRCFVVQQSKIDRPKVAEVFQLKKWMLCKVEGATEGQKVKNIHPRSKSLAKSRSLKIPWKIELLVVAGGCLHLLEVVASWKVGSC